MQPCVRTLFSHASTRNPAVFAQKAPISTRDPDCEQQPLAYGVAGMDECPPDIDCVGAWSSCGSDCRKTYSITTEVSGHGAVCAHADGDIAVCAAGEGECPPDIDCIGEYSTCGSNCQKTYAVTTAVSGQGAACGIDEGAIAACFPGEGDCPAPVETKACASASGGTEHRSATLASFHNAWLLVLGTPRSLPGQNACSRPAAARSRARPPSWDWPLWT